MRVQVLMALVISMAIAVPSLADGKYFAVSTVKDDPTIPAQRAIIAWRDGVETLIVESTVDGEGEAFGWLLPLPASPQAIEPVSAGTLQAMAELVQPAITDDREGAQWRVNGVWMLLLTSLGGTVIIAARRKGVALLGILCLVLLALLAIGLLLPALAEARGGVLLAGIHVLQTHRAGSYDVAAIQGDSVDAVCGWLVSHGFRCDEPSRAVIEKYVAEGWCFAAARIAHDKDGPLSPHPLSVRFSAKELVYPMRLTGVGATTLALDLYIIADRAAAAPYLDAWLCDRVHLDDDQDANLKRHPVAEGKHSRLRIGHPHVAPLFWENAVLTHLRGSLTPQQMADDIQLTFAEFRPQRHRVFSARGAPDVAIGAALLAMSAGIVVAVLLRLARVLAMPGAVRLVAACAVLCLLFGVVLRLTFDVRAIESRGHSIGWRWWAELVGREIATLGESASIEEVRAALTESSHGALRGIEGRPGDVPNGFIIHDGAGAPRVTLYNSIGVPWDIDVAPSRDMPMVID